MALFETYRRGRDAQAAAKKGSFELGHLAGTVWVRAGRKRVCASGSAEGRRGFAWDLVSL